MDSLSFLRQGNDKYYDGNYEEAVHCFTRSIAMKPNLMAFLGRGAALSNMNDYKGALENYSMGFDFIQEQDALTNERKAEIIFGLDTRIPIADSHKALEIFDQSLHFNQDKFGAHIADAYINEYLGYKEKALKSYDYALSLNPKSSTAYFLRANYREKSGDMQGAIEDYTRLIVYNPNVFLIYYLRALIQIKVGAKEEAMKSLEDALRIYKNLEGYKHNSEFNIISFAINELKQQSPFLQN